MEKSGETRHYQYDKQGSLIAEQNGEERTRYQFDSLNRQQEILKADGTFQRNRYDAEGLRAEMEENGRLCRFIFHRGEIISEEVGSESGSYLSSRYIRGNGVEYLDQDGTAYSFQKDEQGSTVFLLDREKEITGSYAYDGFGNLRKSDGLSKHGNRILYAGQQYDGWSEQYYLRARYYNPMIGRFMQEDTYRGDGLNLYAYCQNNPVAYYDPSGYMRLCSDSKFGTDNEESPETLYHYTNEEGMTGIVDSKSLNPSLLSNNPNDCFYGEGQYLSDIIPGDKTPSQLSRSFIGQPFQGKKYSNYVEIDVTGLDVTKGRANVYVVKGTEPLDLTGRITSFGKVKTNR